MTRIIGRRRWSTRFAGTVLALVLMSAGLAACGGTKIPSSAVCPGKTLPSNVTVVHFWSPFTLPSVNTTAEQQFNCSHPHIAVVTTPEPGSGDDSNGKILAAVNAHQPPDLLLSYDDVLAAWAGKGEIQSLNKYNKTMLHLSGSQYVSEAWNSAHWHGKLYGVPVDWDPDALLWWNKKVFAQAGLNPNSAPRTWADLTADAKKITQISGGKIKKVGIAPWSGWGFNVVEFGHLFNAEMNDGRSGNAVTLKSPGMARTLAWESSISKSLGGYTKANTFVSPTGANGTASDPLYSGRVGMEVIGDWEIGGITADAAASAPKSASASAIKAKTDKVYSNFGITTVPSPSGHRYNSDSGWSFMVPNYAKEPQAAMTFVKWLIANHEANAVKYIAEEAGWLTAMKAGRHDSYVMSNPLWRQVLTAARGLTGYWLPPSPILQPYYNALLDAQSAVLTGRSSPQVALKNAQSSVSTDLKSALKSNLYK